MSEMAFTFAAPNAVHYDSVSVKQVWLSNYQINMAYIINLRITQKFQNLIFYCLKYSQVDVPSFSGNFGILPNHVPALAVLSPGVVTVYEDDGGAKKFFVSSGSITINEDASVQILAEEAHAVDTLGKISDN